MFTGKVSESQLRYFPVIILILMNDLMNDSYSPTRIWDIVSLQGE